MKFFGPNHTIILIIILSLCSILIATPCSATTQVNCLNDNTFTAGTCFWKKYQNICIQFPCSNRFQCQCTSPCSWNTNTNTCGI